MKRLLTVIGTVLLMVAAGALPALAGDSRAKSFNADWRFSLGDHAGAEQPQYDDSSWRVLDLPHDWAIEGDFSESNPSGTGGGALPGGVGWYRKTFDLGNIGNDDRVWIDFDGAYMNSTVYINGHELGTRPYGYAPFSYDITPYINRTRPNVIAVRVDNAEQPNSRWYSGCGIYRNVWMRVLDPVHVALWGTCVTTPSITADSATMSVVTTVDNDSDVPVNATLNTRVTDPQGKVVATASAPVAIEPNSAADCVQELIVPDPQLWSVDTPQLYTVVTDVMVNGLPVDTYATVTGLRYFAFDPVKGFSLNGKPMKINGVCMHHDLGALGAAVNRRGIERQLEILKEMGANAYRCSHNPPAPEVLELCDRMGLIVMDETFDMWRKKKTAHDYSRYFNDWHERDLADLVMRDRNHPSIMMWSIGNEVLEQWSDANADTLSLEEANMILNFGHSKEMLAAENGEMSVNSLLTKKLADMVRDLDPTRPVTAGCNEPDPGNHLFRSGALDIIGYNYHDNWFDSVPGWFPDKPFIVTESVSGLMTRGHYVMPSDSIIICPERWDKPYYDPSFACSAYDNCHVPWGNSHEGTMRHVKNKDFISGQFVWTGFDYLGEPTPYGWPARSSYFGIVDLAGFPKDVYYMYQSEWRPDKNVLHLFPHWNWTPGQTVDMWAYYNNADEVELFINGRSQGVKSKGPDDFHVMWRVTFEPGEVKAVSRRNGKVVAEQTIRTAGSPAQLRLIPDRTTINADGSDLSYVTVEVLDNEGNLCPDADNEVTFAVTGAGRNEGVDNGSPISLERFKADSHRVHKGKGMLIVRSNGQNGPINVTATAKGLRDASTTILTN